MNLSIHFKTKKKTSTEKHKKEGKKRMKSCSLGEGKKGKISYYSIWTECIIFHFGLCLFVYGFPFSIEEQKNFYLFIIVIIFFLCVLFCFVELVVFPFSYYCFCPASLPPCKSKKVSLWILLLEIALVCLFRTQAHIVCANKDMTTVQIRVHICKTKEKR